MFFGYVLMAFGALWTLMALFLGRRQRRFNARSIACDAVVKDVVTLGAEIYEDVSRGLFPVVEFVLPSGQRVTVTVTSSTISRSAIGRRIRIRYDPKNHENVGIASTANALGPAITVTIGIGLITAGFFLARHF